MKISEEKVTIEITTYDLTRIRRAIECCLKSSSMTDAKNTVINKGTQDELKRIHKTIESKGY